MIRKLCGTLGIATLVAGWGALAGAGRPGPGAGAGCGRRRRLGNLTIDSLLDIRFPSAPVWSPDGRTIAFLWDRAGVQNVFTAPAAGGPPVALTHYDSDLIGSLFWSHDGRTIHYVRQGGLWQVPAGGGAPAPVWKTNDKGGGFALSPDGTRVAFSRGGELYVRPLDGETETRLTNTPTAETGPVWSPDGSHLAFAIRRATRHEDAPSWSGAKILFTWFESADTKLGVVPVAGGPVVPLDTGAGNDGAVAWVDAGHVVFQRVTDDVHTREIVVADATTGAGRVVHRDTDPKWWDMLFLDAEPQPSPDGRWIAFLSDADGWAHLYVMPASGGTPVQITRGHFEVQRAAWSPDSRRIVFDANQESQPGRRELMVADLGSDPGAAHLETITTGIGTNTDARWAPAGDDLVFEHTDPHNAADLYVVRPSVGTKPTRLTDSLPAAVSRDALVAPQFVHYPSADGTPVPAYLFVPHDLDRARKHPAIIWVHGDGINQNYEGWHIHRDYGVSYSFHQYLVQHGYVVLSVDYRGSIGYGRAWRESVYRDLGGKDFQDVAAGAKYLASLGYVDPQRIGIWGLSYGGFLTLQALTETPTLFNCGVDVAGVVDWNMWYQDPGGAWIRGRMGRPEDNPALYRARSPIYRVDRIVRPLLVLGGTADVNVPFIESLRLVNELEADDKSFDLMVYPGEFHYFHRAQVLRDAWTRVARFFDEHLRGK